MSSSEVGSSADVDQPIQIAREQHVGRLLLQAQRVFNTRAVSKLQAHGYHDLTLAHVTLLPYIDANGSRITTLAERAGMTKQGMGQLITELERQGYLVRRPDPSDRRATLVAFTERGTEFLRNALAVIDELEAEFAAILGVDGFEILCTSLAKIVAHRWE